MTCIVGMVKNDQIYMAGDLMGSNGYTKKVYPDSKVFLNGEFLLGYTSSFRMGQILEWNWEPPLRQEGISDRQYMQLNVVESLRDTFATFGYGIKQGLEDLGGTFLIGYRGKLYEMQDNFSLLQNEDFVAVGSGQYHAEAVMHVLYNTEIHPFDILQEAISTAAHFTSSVSEECTLLTTDEAAAEEYDKLLSEGEFSVEGIAEEVLLEADLPQLKEIADGLSIKYPHNIKEDTLRNKILDYVNIEVEEAD